jgi:ubiquinone/menaquinone biosynthesis C-methylase UbiE
MNALGPFAEAVEFIFGMEFPSRPGEPALRSYYGDLRDPSRLQEFNRYHEDMLRFAGFDPAGKDVLEVGSGFGVVLVWLALRGAKVQGVELVPWMVDDVRSYLELLPVETPHVVTVRQGSASRLPQPDSSVDLVLAIETVSHYLEYKPFLAEAHRVLRPGGKLLVIDGNNGLNPAIRRHCTRVWARHERDLPAADDDPWLFVPKRQQIIQEAFPEIDAERAHTLALRTAGLIRAEIVEAVRGYLATGDLPDHPYKRGRLTVHPEHEMVMERLFNPFALAGELRSLGFTTKVQGYWGGARGAPALRAANRVLATLSALTIFSARSLRIVATKR